MPYMWWTTGVAYDTDKIKGDPDQQHGPLGPDATTSTSACSTTTRRSSRLAADPARLRRQHDRPRPARRGPGPARAAEAAACASTPHRHRRDDDAAGDIWIGHVWGADFYTMLSQTTTKTIYYIPEEGARPRLRHDGDLLGRAAPDRRAPVHQLHMLDAQVSADNTNFIGYMGPERRRQGADRPGDPGGPERQPGARPRSTKLTELARARRPRTLDEYPKRWRRLTS